MLKKENNTIPALSIKFANFATFNCEVLFPAVFMVYCEILIPKVGRDSVHCTSKAWVQPPYDELALQPLRLIQPITDPF